MRHLKIAAVLIALALLPALHASPGLNPTYGLMTGVVVDVRGTPQMGAQVALIASDGRILQQVYSNDKGMFLLERVLPGLYSLRVSLASFLPVLKENVLIEPGIRSFLSINMASLFDAVDVVRGRRTAGLSDDDWTWVVRTSGATRPALRFQETPPEPTQRAAVSAPDVHQAVLQFNGGAGHTSRAGSVADFNTSFTLTDNLFRNTRYLISGNVGYDRSTPATAVRATLRRELPGGSTPEVSVTLRQIFLPSAFFGMSGARNERMQGLTLAASDHMRIAGDFEIEYGFLYESIDFLQRLNTFSPYGRILYQQSPSSKWQFYYTEGAPREALPGGSALGQVASDIGVFPRVSLLDGRPTIQRGRHVELSYQRKVGESTKLEAGVYRDQMTDLAVNAGLDSDEPAPADFLPDVFTRRHSFNSGNHQTLGLRAAVQQKFGDRLEATFAYTYGGVLTPDRLTLYNSDAQDLRSMLRMHQTHALAARLAADVPVTQTRVYAGYKWVMAPAAVSVLDIYDESIAAFEPHLNVLVRQPLPSIVVLPGRIEALADFRNLLAQGYVPITTASGRRLLLVQNVRSFRGGLSFVF